ncbi:unnamed protein product [Leptosia nina]|uniref:Metallo-beta-lactamase domain-containing protein 1 n=1 Tax=Leptosia nina TaxID=320188 RepID=A0AAV1J668_9NEOP
MCEVAVLHDGYSNMNGDGYMIANCTCSVITGINNIIVDTMTPWDSKIIINSLKKRELDCEQIEYVISTHGHSDHIGNNNLFLKATHIVGWSISFKNKYFIHPFEKGEEYVINGSVKVLPTPGHTLSDVTVLVKTKDEGTIAITGDLFEKCEDISNETLWKDMSEDPAKQSNNRSMIANLADWIIPGHGPMFRVTNDMREMLKSQATNYNNNA